MTRAELRKQAADAGISDTGKYVEWLEEQVLHAKRFLVAEGRSSYYFRCTCGEQFSRPEAKTVCPACGMAQEVML